MKNSEINNQILLGSHIKMAAPDYFLGAVHDAISFGETCFMFYTGAPQNTSRVDIEKCKIEEGLSLMKENNISEDGLVVHAPYILNLANTLDEDKFNFSLNFLKSEVYRTKRFHANKLILHPGNSLGADINLALEKVALGLNIILKDDQSNIKICLETMAGKGSEVGKTFEEIAFIISKCNYKDNIGVCLDTCHINDAGYDIADLNKVLEEFDRIIGLKYLKVIHLNNSKNAINSHKDRHANIQDGTIPPIYLKNIVFDERLKNIPKILETPYINGLPPYKEEIKFLKS